MGALRLEERGCRKQGGLAARHADELRGGASGVQQRTEKVEHSSLPAFGAKFPRGRNVFESGMILRREKERELMLTQRLRGLRRI